MGSTGPIDPHDGSLGTASRHGCSCPVTSRIQCPTHGLEERLAMRDHDDLIEELLDMTPLVSQERYDAVVNERDRWHRLFNRIEAAISHHKKHTDRLFADNHDEALYAARDRILRDSYEGRG